MDLMREPPLVEQLTEKLRTLRELDESAFAEMVAKIVWYCDLRADAIAADSLVPAHGSAGMVAVTAAGATGP